MQSKDEIHLTTQIFKDSTRLLVNYTKSSARNNHFKISFFDDDREIGNAVYHIREDHLYIESITNFFPNQYTGIGNGLHEFIFRESWSSGKGGRVKLHAYYGLQLLHYNFGFRAEVDYGFRLGNIWDKNVFRRALDQLIEQGCLYHPLDEYISSDIENNLLKSLNEEEKEDYAEIKQNFTRKNPGSSFTDFMLQHVFEYDQKNNLLKKLYENSDPVKTEGILHHLNGILMLIPNEIIIAKKKQFDLPLTEEEMAMDASYQDETSTIKISDIGEEKAEENEPYLKTRVLKKGVIVPLTYTKEPFNDHQYRVSLRDGMLEIGYAIYHLQEETLYIDMMMNTCRNDYSQVGTALHEFLFKESCLFNRGGRVKHDAAYSSHLFHYNFGFRAEAHYEFRLGLAFDQNAFKVALNQLLELGCPNNKPEKHVINDIEKNLLEALTDAEEKADYEEIKQKFLHKNPHTDFVDLMFNHIYEYDYKNNVLKKLHAKAKSGKRIDTSYLTSMIMYLPDETIIEKKKQYGLSLTDQHVELSNEKEKTSSRDGGPHNLGLTIVIDWIKSIKKSNQYSFFGTYSTNEANILNRILQFLEGESNDFPPQEDLQILQKGDLGDKLNHFFQENGQYLAPHFGGNEIHSLESLYTHTSLYRANI